MVGILVVSGWYPAAPIGFVPVGGLCRCGGRVCGRHIAYCGLVRVASIVEEIFGVFPVVDFEAEQVERVEDLIVLADSDVVDDLSHGILDTVGGVLKSEPVDKVVWGIGFSVVWGFAVVVVDVDEHIDGHDR